MSPWQKKIGISNVHDNEVSGIPKGNKYAKQYICTVCVKNKTLKLIKIIADVDI